MLGVGEVSLETCGGWSGCLATWSGMCRKELGPAVSAARGLM